MPRCQLMVDLATYELRIAAQRHPHVRDHAGAAQLCDGHRLAGLDVEAIVVAAGWVEAREGGAWSAWERAELVGRDDARARQQDGAGRDGTA